MKYFLVLFALFSLIFGQNLSFVKEPALTQNGSTWTISFEVSQNTDVEVSVVDLSDSSVIRHLAAGMLGANTVPPLASNALSQTLTWDGKDDLGNTVANTSNLSVRVRAGMSVALNNITGGSVYAFGRKVMGLSLGDDGSIYVFGVNGTLPSTTIRQYDGNGNYIKTVFPYAASLTADQVNGFGIVEWGNGKYQPQTTFIAYPNISKTLITNQENTIWPSTSGGVLTVFSPNGLKLIKVKTTGEITGDGTASRLVTSPDLPQPENYSIGGPIYVTQIPGKNYVYLSGIYHWSFESSYVVVDKSDFWHDGQVFKVDLTTGAATPFIQLDSVPPMSPLRQGTIGPRYEGNSNAPKSNAAIHGVAEDAQGRVYICDRWHKEVGVYDAGGNKLGAIAITNPDLVEVNKTTGEVYVVTRILSGYHTGLVSMFKFAPFDQGSAVLAQLPGFITKVGTKFAAPYAEKVYMVVSTSGAKPVLWFSSYSSTTDMMQNSVWALRDDGDKFTVIQDFAQSGVGVNLGFDRLAVDRRNETVYIQDSWNGILKIEDWDNPVVVPCTLSSKQRLYGTDFAITPDYLFMVREGTSYSGPIRRYTLNRYHAPANFSNTSNNEVINDIYSRFGQGYAERGLAVNLQGKLAIIYMYDWAKYFVDIFNAGGNASHSSIIQPLTSECGGVKYDLKGNLYIGSLVRQSGHIRPTPFQNDQGYDYSVGSILRYGPGAGGSTSVGGDPDSRSVSGANKVYKTGVAPFSGMYQCACRSPRFDVDPYGRLFIPNAITGKVTVIDNNENQILQFGDWGNIDSKGPGSLVPQPDIPLAWPVGAAASEDFIYVTDMINTRLLQIIMNYELDNIPGLTNHGVGVDAVLTAENRISLMARPNPFRPVNYLTINLPKARKVRLDVYDVTGKFIRTIANARFNAGPLYLRWDGTDKHGRPVAAGTYVYKMRVGKKVLTKKVTLTK